MRSIRLVAATALLAVGVAACHSAHPAANRSQPAIPPATGGQTATPSPTRTPKPTATTTAATTVDPCQLVTPQEASALTGASYGPGKLEVDSAASRRCIYGYQTRHVFEVIFVQGTSTDQAKAYASSLRAQAQQQLGAHVALAQVSGIGDDAETLRGNQAGIDMSGLYVLHGAAGFALVDVALGHAASTAALTTQAQTVLGRLP